MSNLNTDFQCYLCYLALSHSSQYNYDFRVNIVDQSLAKAGLKTNGLGTIIKSTILKAFEE